MKINTLSKGLVGHWQLDNKYGAKDRTPYSNNGTGAGGITIGGATDRHGQAGKATTFDGSDDYIDCGNNNVFNFTTEMSAFTWVKGSSQGGDTGIITKFTSGVATRSWGMTGSGSTFYVIITQGGAYPTNAKHYITSITTFNNVWHHIGFTFSGGILKIYVDGVLDSNPTKVVDNSVSSIYTSTNNVNIGTLPSAQKFTGSISDTRIYNRALSQTEITALYEGYNPSIKINSKPEGMVGRWKLDNANLLRDVSLTGNNGTAQGGLVVGGAVNHRGTVGGATTFNGSSDYVGYGDVMDIRTNSFSVSFWVKGDALGTKIPVSKSYAGPGTGRWWFSYESSQTEISFKTEMGGTVYAVTKTGFWDGTWKHVVGVLNRTGNMSLYVNGILSGTPINISAYSAVDYNTTYPFNIAGYNNVPQFAGQISDPQIFNRALTTQEVKQLYLTDEISKIKLFKA